MLVYVYYTNYQNSFAIFIKKYSKTLVEIPRQKKPSQEINLRRDFFYSIFLNPNPRINSFNHFSNNNSSQNIAVSQVVFRLQINLDI